MKLEQLESFYSKSQLDTPKIVIGVPVYNGENYLSRALDSFLNQTLSNFRVIISDNASTDATAEIAQEYARRDDRILYYRQKQNIGAAPNFNFVFQPGNAPYFKWAAHDDMLEPDYLRQCVELLDQNPSLAIAHCPSSVIDTEDCKVGTNDKDLLLNGSSASERFWRILWTGHFTEVFGVMRSDLVAKTKLHGSYIGSDRNFMSEMLLLGDVGYVQDRLFCHRRHAASYMRILTNNADRLKWFDPKVKIPNTLVGYVKFQEYLSAIRRLPLPTRERVACVWMLAEWSARRGLEVLSGDRDQYRKKLHRKYSMSQALTQS